MAKRTQKFSFEELDKETREYLLTVRDRKGRGMPGLYIATGNQLPIIGLICGILVLIIVWAIAWNQMEQEPLGVAMLQTVGLMLGGWMIAYAIRSWVAARRDNYAGHYIYADAETLWECAGSTVTATDIFDVVDSEGVANYTKEGKYQNTSVTVFMKKGKHTLTMANERKAERLTIFLNTMAWLRSGGDSKKGGEDPSELPAAILGGIARANAKEDHIPRKWTASALDIDYEEVPIPKRKNKPVFGLVPLLVIPAVGLLLILVFKSLNVGWRDDAIWDKINEISDQDSRAPWLRGYLADARNTKHRDQARQMLRSIYSSAVARIRGGNLLAQPGPNNPFNQPNNPFNQPNNPINQPNLGANGRIDKDLVDGLEIVLLELAELPLPDVAISVKDKTGGGQAASREETFMKNFAKGIFEGVGEQLIRIAQAPADAKGMIDVTIEYARDKQLQVTFTISFRKKPDDAALKTVRKTMTINDDSAATLGPIATNLGLSTAGPPKPKPPPPVDSD